jgi:hypothetical protein
LADIDLQTRGKAAEEARAAIDAVLNAEPFDPSGKPAESTGAVPALELHHDTKPFAAPTTQPEGVQPVLPVDEPLLVPTEMPSMAPPLPPLPDFSTLPQFPVDEPLGAVPPQVPSLEPDVTMPQPPQAPSNDPTQFRLPGQ